MYWYKKFIKLIITSTYYDFMIQSSDKKICSSNNCVYIYIKSHNIGQLLLTIDYINNRVWYNINCHNYSFTIIDKKLNFVRKYPLSYVSINWY